MSAQYKYKNPPLIFLTPLILIVAIAGCGGGASSTPADSTPDAAQIVLSPNSLDFGSVTVGVQKTASVTVSNSRGSTAHITQITATGAGFSVVNAPAMPLALPAGTSATLTVGFKPSSAGAASGGLSILFNGKTPSISYSMTGTGVATAGQLSVSPSAMAFGDVLVGSSQKLTGSLAASGSSVTVSSASWNGAGYSLSGIAFPVTVPAGQSIAFAVTFAPQTAGSSAGNVSFSSNASNSTATETLSGNGVQPAHSVDVSWSASTSVVLGYNIYRGIQSGGPYTKLNSSVQPGTTYTDTNVQAGATYFYVVTSVDGNLLESALSVEIKAVIPVP